MRAFGKLVILFDGLDELVMQGKALADVANAFVRNVVKTVIQFNNDQCKLQVIISGREVIVQQQESDFREEGQVLRLLEYYLPDEDKYGFSGETWDLLQEDQRQKWWHQYGELIGKRYAELPADLIKEDLDVITAQPLLNYLVALSYARGKVATNLNEIYADLLRAVHERNYAGGQKLASVAMLTMPQFQRVLEEIALAAWHGKGRTTSIGEIRQHFESAGLHKLLDQFVKGAEKGLFSLLTAFYFRQAGLSTDGEGVFRVHAQELWGIPDCRPNFPATSIE